MNAMVCGGPDELVARPSSARCSYPAVASVIVKVDEVDGAHVSACPEAARHQRQPMADGLKPNRYSR
jgi:hypothetical protein